MKTLVSESYTIAWFKIADFVARGEKERALNVYRLLMHSVSEPAISYQLEGDILLAFDDDAAIDRYHVAANLYKRSGKMKQAISVYEHVALFKEDAKILEALLDTYVAVGNKNGILESFARLSKVCLQQQQQDLVVEFLHRYSFLVDDITQALLHARFVRCLLLYGQYQDISSYVRQTVDLFLAAFESCKMGDKDMQRFLVDVKALNTVEYEKAQEYLRQTVSVETVAV
jgi:tetratricopeptide (TPR) repeat protein